MTPSSILVKRNNVRVVGTGPQTVILAHGFGSDQTVWRHHEAALSEVGRVILFDHVGAGQSDVNAYSPRRYRSLHAYAADLLEILSEFSAQEVTYIGHSMSGMIGLLAALSDPERFARMVFIGASPRYLNDRDYRGGFEQKDIDALYAGMTTNYHAWASGFAGLAMGNDERPELAAEFTKTLSAIRPDIAVAVARLIFQSDHRAELPKLTKPTLIVQSQQDVAVPAEVGQFLSQHIPHAELCMVDAQGHFPHLSAPGVVLQAIRSFLPWAASH